MTMALPPNLVQRIPAIIGRRKAAIQYGPIGIDVGSNGLRLVQFKQSGDDVELSASALVPFPDEAKRSAKQARALIKQTFRKHGFVGRDVVTCLQPEDVKIMMISYLHKAGKNDEELIVQRIAERVDDDIQNYVIDFMMVRPQVKDEQERSVLVAMAQHEKVINYLEYLREAGLAVKVLEIESTAIHRLVSVKHGCDHEANLITVSMGYARTYITVLSGRRLIYERDINFGEQQLIELLCKELDLDEHEARTMLVSYKENLATDIGRDEQDISITNALYSVLKPQFMMLMEDINRALVYAASETRGMPVEHIYLTNLVATWRGIENFIDSLIDVPVSVLLPFEGFSNKEAFQSDIDPRGAVATGMALHGLTEVG